MPLLAITGTSGKKLNQLGRLPHGQRNGSNIGRQVGGSYACGSQTKMFELVRHGNIAGNGAAVAGAKGRAIIGMIVFGLSVCF